MATRKTRAKTPVRPATTKAPSAPPDDVGTTLKRAKFTETTSDISRAVGHRTFNGKKVGHWVLHATSFPKEKEYAVEMVLNRPHEPGGIPYGTKHCFVTIDALARELDSAIRDLTRLAKDDELLKCPKCGIRYVIQKEGRRGTFLSCEGMRRIHRRLEGVKIKDVACNGTSDRIPPIVVH